MTLNPVLVEGRQPPGVGQLNVGLGSNLRRRRQVYRRAGASNASSHTGRKTFLTSVASQSVSVFVLARLAEHKSISTTQRYITVNDDVKRLAVELV